MFVINFFREKQISFVRGCRGKKSLDSVCVCVCVCVISQNIVTRSMFKNVLGSVNVQCVLVVCERG